MFIHEDKQLAFAAGMCVCFFGLDCMCTPTQKSDGIKCGDVYYTLGIWDIITYSTNYGYLYYAVSAHKKNTHRF